MNGKEFMIKQLDLTANQMTYKNNVFDVLTFVNSPLDGVFVRGAYFESLIDADEYAVYMENIYDTKYTDLDYAVYVMGRCHKERNLAKMLDATANENNLIKK